MKVYLVILEDRHDDVQVEVYATAESALERARAVTREERTSHRYDPDEAVDCPVEWLFCAELSSEGDCVRVEEAEVI